MVDLSAARGSAFDGGADPFYGIVDVFRTADGRIAVADRGTMSIRLFRPDGAEAGQVGRRGQGPGEFQALESAGRLPGDSLWGYDFQGGLVHVFGADGRVVRSTRLQLPDGSPFRALVGPAGDVWVGRRGMVVGAGEEGGLRRDTVSVHRVASDGADRGILTRQPGDEQWVRVRTQGGRTEVSKSLMPFSYRTLDAVSGERWLTVQTERYLLRVQAPATDAPPIWVRVRVDPRPVDVDLLIAYAREVARGSGDPGVADRVRRRVGAMPLHEWAPEIEAVAPSTGGGFWVRRFTAPEETTSEWVVHGPDGRPLKRVLLPAAFRVREAGEGWLVATTIDDLGVERVVLVEHPALG
jgi:hypothetical protein